MRNNPSHKIVRLVVRAAIGLIAALGVILITRNVRPAWLWIGVMLVVLLSPDFALSLASYDLALGSKRLKTKRFADAEMHATRFLALIRRRPWLKRLLWVRTGSLSSDVEVVALSILGNALIGLGVFDRARRELERAIQLDPRSWLPRQALGVMELLIGNMSQGGANLAEAAARGGKALAFQPTPAPQGGRPDSLAIEKPSTRNPPLRRQDDHRKMAGDFVVEMVNDDKTPMLFVVEVLQDVFGKSVEEARQIMQQTHRAGRASCGAFGVQDAEAILAEIHRRANAAGYPLTCVLKPNW